MKLSATMIVKNEASIVAKALSSVAEFDEIIVVDTGSTDGTQDICRQFTDKVFDDFVWCDDFAAARNHAIEKATGDWIFSIDADHALLSDVDEVRREALRAESAGEKVAKVRSIMAGGEHWREVLFQNDPSIRWTGAVHEVLQATNFCSTIERRCGYSGNHRSDPDRNLRILQTMPQSPRQQFYMGREYFERRMYENAIAAMKSYLKLGTYLPEIAEAHLVLARCYWQTNRGTDARNSCLEAIRQNPDFAEALRFMGELHYEPHKSKWQHLSHAATNADVLFIRG